jgi:fructokinase
MLSSEAIKKSELIFLEGYLWDEGEPKKAFDKAIKNANKVAMSLSDLFCVDRHKPHFLNLVKNKLDITFANEQEITSLIEAKNFSEVIDFSKQLNKLIVVTRGEKGAVAINGEEIFESDVKKNLEIVDLTGAGDLFAAGFLHGYINKLSVKECLGKRYRNVIKSNTTNWCKTLGLTFFSFKTSLTFFRLNYFWFILFCKKFFSYWIFLI